MIHLLEASNITKVTSGVIIHGVNCQGVMGSGVAKQLRAKYPDIFYSYLQEYSTIANKASLLGTINIVPVSATLSVINAFTQEYYGRDGKQYVSYDAIAQALYKAHKSFSLSVPFHIPYLIGAGLGGGDVGTILDIIQDTFENREVYLHRWK